MGRMLSSKALIPRAEPREGLRKPVATAVVTPVPLVPPAPSENIQDRAERQNPLRKIAFYAGLGFLFLRFSAISELLLFYTHINFYLLYLFAPLSILGMLTTGGVARSFRHNSSKYWVAFYVWMILATPFSFWRGDSLALIITYGRVQLAMLFVMAGLAMTWKEIRLIFYTIAAAAVTNLATARLFATLDEGGRINMEASGNIGNSNDLGTHLLLVMPFLIFVIIDRARSKILRIPLVLAIAYGVWVVLGTGSRGCMLAMGAMLLFALWRATPAQRVGTLIVALVLAVAIPLMLPGSVVTRLGSLFNEDQHREGRESAEAREYLLKQSLLYTFQHPLLGVGPGQFPNYEGNQRTSEGKRGQWKVTHNFLTEVSSECGIPALIFMLMSIGSALLLVNRTFRQARRRGFRDITNACFCYQLGMVGYLCSVVFLAHAYLFYLPTMVGLAISMSLVAMRQMAAPQVQTVAAVPARF